MSNEGRSGEEPRKCPFLDSLKSFAEEFKRSQVCEHIRGVQREALLTVRSLLDVCIERLQPKEPQGDQPGRKITVE